MIPHRIQLSGFLSYKESQEVQFGAASLWMLAGTNGSGKSSVFDAVTYALFGHHRGGSQNAAELINKESSALLIEFDFQLDGRLYRIKRTVRRNAKGALSSTQQLFTNTVGDEWEAVPDTSKKVDFDKWIHEKIGLNYETFTSSVLLLQGRAEKLLDARPSGRAEVLAGIVDLERYQRLHEKANSRKLELKSRLEAISHQTAAVPEVSDLDFAAAVLRIEECDAARKDAQTRIDEAVNLEVVARRWADTHARLEAARTRLTHAESLLGDGLKIEAAFSRLKELREVLPSVNTILSMRANTQESERKSARFEKDRAQAQERKIFAEREQETIRKKQTTLRKALESEEAKLTKANARLRELQGLLEKVRLAEQQEAELRRLTDELKRLPEKPEQAVHDAQQEVERLTELNRILPILERFQTERHDLAVAYRTEEEAKQSQHKTLADGETMKAEDARLQPEVEAAKTARSTADQQVAVTKVMAERAREAREELATLTGEPNCRTCGQPLTEQHLAEETKRREADVVAAAAAHREAIQAAKQAVERERSLTTRAEELSRKLVALREAYRDQLAQVKQAAADVKRLTDSLELRYAEMPEPFRSHIAPSLPRDWTETRYPERDQLIQLRDESRNLDAAKRRYREAQDSATKSHQLQAKSESARATLTRLKEGLPAEVAKLRREHADLQAEESSLLGSIRGTKSSLQDIDLDLDKLGREGHTAVHLLTDLQGKLNTEIVTRKHCADAIERATATLPPSWRDAVEGAALNQYSQWKSEAERLAADGIEAKYKQLELAKGGLTSLRAEIDDLTEQADAFPQDQRRTPDEVKLLLVGARQEYSEREEELRDAQKAKSILDGHREQRVKLGEQFREFDGQHNRYKILSELLGRDRLQRHLVRQAERQIVDHANAVLDRLSGGQLFLRLVGGDEGTSAEKALDLECSNRITGGAPINVTFLSGSQRFRVAVSLALAIGQYASKQHRPIESVIIDEGFGCLDRQGRQVMIQELQNLRGHLRCILLVSHQEEFADAFADGYRFELHDGATRVKRFQS